MGSILQELQELLRMEVDAAISDGVLHPDERERIYNRLKEIMDEVWIDKVMSEEERETIMNIYEECLSKLRGLPTD